MEFRLILAVLIVVGCMLCGQSMARTLERRHKLLCECVDALKKLRIYIVNMLQPVQTALRDTSFSLFCAVAEVISESERALDAWQQVVSDAGKRGQSADSLGVKELRALERMFEQLGESGREAQDTAIRACISELELLRDSSREEVSAKSRLYISLGILLGLAIAVMVI